MLSNEIQTSLKKLLSDHLKIPLPPIRFEGISGGSINQAFRMIAGQGRQYFLKLNSATDYPGLFVKEKNGLEFLDKPEASQGRTIIRVPAVIGCGVINTYQFLVLEWIERGTKTRKFWNEFGEQLAVLHKVSRHSFVFHEDNYMGALTQRNDLNPEWISFFIQNRLQPQVELANLKNRLEAKHITGFETIYARLPEIFNKEPSSLLHGDLWSGNFMCDESNRPVLIDPAVYFGHRSVDLGMSTLFGGFDNEFYEAYNYNYPFPTNYKEQWEVANLYPLLIHLNLFGKTYLPQIESIIKKYQ